MAARPSLKFGVHIPTCIEGMMYPVPFAKPEDVLPTAQLAERVGFDSVWGNDHMTTQRYVQQEWPQPPNFYEPLITFTWVAARTERIKLATGIIVLPMRTMPVLAKQVATLDQLSGGRVILGVGTGAYREEYEALYPDAKDARRGEIVDEGMRALRLLFTERKASFSGRHVRFRDVECFPKPRQTPLPMYAGGNHAEVRRRAGEYGEGWMPAVLSPRRSPAVWRRPRAAGKAGRDGSTDRHRAAVRVLDSGARTTTRSSASTLAALQASESLNESTLREQQAGGFEQRNLIGSPTRFASASALPEGGVTTCRGCSSSPTPCRDAGGHRLFGRE
jgi:probable F420-dependent oxidoreductase